MAGAEPETLDAPLETLDALFLVCLLIYTHIHMHAYIHRCVQVVTVEVAAADLQTR